MNWLEDLPIVKERKHREYLRQAYAYAWFFSDDDVTKVGAIIVKPTLEKKADLNQILGYGANSYPPRLNPSEEQKKDKNWKKDNIIHAEKSAIFDVLKNYSITSDLIMYMPWAACEPCAKEIVKSGLKTVIGHKELIERTTERWLQSTSRAINFLINNDVKMFMYSGKIGGIKNIFDGEQWNP